MSEVQSVGAALLIWAWCGVSSALLALCYAELGTTIVVSGGDYAYLRVIFSPFLAFIVLWMNIAFMQVGKETLHKLKRTLIHCGTSRVVLGRTVRKTAVISALNSGK